MLYGIQAQELLSSMLSPTIDAVRIDNRTSDNGLVATATIADTPLLTASLWFKISKEDYSQHSLFQLNDFSSYVFLTGSFGSRYIVISLVGSSGKYFQFGSDGGLYNEDVWNHLFVSADTNHAAGSKLKTILLNGADVDFPAETADSDAAFDILLNSKNFGIPGATGNLGSSQDSLISYADVWIAPGIYLTASDILKFRSSNGKPVDLGSNGEIPTGSPPAYYFHGDASSFATNLGGGGAVSLVGSLTSVRGPLAIESPTKFGSADLQGIGNLSVGAVQLNSGSSAFFGSSFFSIDGNLTNPIQSGNALFSGSGNFNVNTIQLGDFRPSDLASLVGWWDAADISTLTDAGSGHCSQWNDKSANANHVTQTTDGRRPIITPNGLNGLTTLVFTGGTGVNGHVLAKLTASGLPSITTGLSFAAVAKFNTTANQTIYDASSTTSTNTASMCILESSTLKVRNSGTSQASTAYSDTTNANVFTGMNKATSPQKLSINGTEYNNAVTATNYAINNIRFGQVFGDTLALNGLIAEIIFCSGDLSTDDRQNLEGYLAWKWGRELALPAGHPYASAPP